MRKEELGAEKKSIDLIKDFVSLRKHRFRDLEDSADKLGVIDDTEKELMDAISKLEDDLMEIEMLL